MLLTMSQDEVVAYHEDRKLIDFRLTTMEQSITKLADTVTSYINSNDKSTVEIKTQIKIAAAVVAVIVSTLVTIAVKVLWK